MGTCFYWHPKSECQTCGHEEDEVLIGKSSAGWCFALHVDDEVRSLSGWIERFFRPGSHIKDEYGDNITPLEMVDRIANRSGHDNVFDPVWLRDNHAAAGPRGLVRHAIYGNCVGHGEGTWDYIEGEFS